jgi:hypothetical protein
MGQFVASVPLKLVGWLATLVMAAVCAMVRDGSRCEKTGPKDARFG